MALKLGWRAGEKWESIWRTDPALDGVTAAALAAFDADGDASHLEEFATKGTPTRITFRTLNGDELRHCRGPAFDAQSIIGGAIDRIYRLAFRIGVSMENMPTTMRDEGGKDHPTIIRESGFRMLANGFVDALDREYPGIVDFYGGMIFNASSPSEKEKKASSPQSTPTPSSAGGSTPGTTDGSPPAAGA